MQNAHCDRVLARAAFEGGAASGLPCRHSWRHFSAYPACSLTLSNIPSSSNVLSSELPP